VRPPLPPGAETAGLQVGDLIVSINGVGPASNAAALAQAQEDFVLLVVMREGERVSLWFRS
jgi:predicted metalloprotease with PDZ domain